MEAEETARRNAKLRVGIEYKGFNEAIDPI